MRATSIELPTMIQAIAGVSPAETKEMTVMTVWPSVAMFGRREFLDLSGWPVPILSSGEPIRELL